MKVLASKNRKTRLKLFLKASRKTQLKEPRTPNQSIIPKLIIKANRKM